MFGLNFFSKYVLFLMRNRNLYWCSLKILKLFLSSLNEIISLSFFFSSHNKPITRAQISRIFVNVPSLWQRDALALRRLDESIRPRRKTIYRKSSTREGEGFFANVMVLSENFLVVQRKRNSLAGNFMTLRAQSTLEGLCDTPVCYTRRMWMRFIAKDASNVVSTALQIVCCKY